MKIGQTIDEILNAEELEGTIEFMNEAKKQKVFFLMTERKEEFQWKVTFGSNVKRKKNNTYYFYVSINIDASKAEDSVFDFSFSSVFESDTDKPDRKHTDMIDEIASILINDQGLGCYLLNELEAVQAVGDEFVIIPKEERKPFNYVEDIRCHFFENLKEETRENIDRTMRMDTKLFFKRNGWSTSEFPNEDVVSFVLFEFWTENSMERGSKWLEDEECEFEDISLFQFYMHQHIIRHAKQVFVEKGLEFKVEEKEIADVSNVLSFES